MKIFTSHLKYSIFICQLVELFLHGNLVTYCLFYHIFSQYIQRVLYIRREIFLNQESRNFSRSEPVRYLPPRPFSRYMFEVGGSSCMILDSEIFRDFPSSILISLNVYCLLECDMETWFLRHKVWSFQSNTSSVNFFL